MKLKILPLCVFKSSQFLLLRGKTMGINTYVLLKGTDLNTHLPWVTTSNSFRSPFGANSCSLHEAFHIHIQAPSVSSTVSPAPFPNVSTWQFIQRSIYIKPVSGTPQGTRDLGRPVVPAFNAFPNCWSIEWCFGVCLARYSSCLSKVTNSYSSFKIQLRDTSFKTPFSWASLAAQW